MRQVDSASLANEAGYFYLMLSRDLVPLSDCARWADGLIASLEHPRIEYIDISLCRKVSDCLSLLRKLISGSVPLASVHLAAAFVGRLLREGQVDLLDALRHVLAFYGAADAWQSDEYYEVVGLEDDLEPGSIQDPTVVKLVEAHV